ncbi:MAG: preprotein translocase subunit SecY [Candidatus Heimdallarchaeota archaeon]
MPSTFLRAFKPFMGFVPEVKKPEVEVPFNRKLIYTFLALITYFIMSSITIYGIEIQQGGTDPFYWVRTIMASSRGTLAELGIGPIVTAGLIMQILVGSKIINVDMADPEDRSLYTGVQKVLAVFMTIFEAFAYILGGAYGDLGLNQVVLVLTQLIAAGLVIILLDEMVQKGWGLGSGISLFIAAGVAQQIMWNAFALIQSTTDTFYHGAIVAFLQALFGAGAVRATLIRAAGTPDILGVFATIAVFLIVIYFEAMRIEIPVQYARYRGLRGKYPIKLLYVSNIPVILASAVFADIFFVAKMFHNRWGDNFFVRLLGTFNDKGSPEGGLAYFISPPRGPQEVLAEPLHALIYAAILIILCIGFSKMWLETAGMGPATVAQQLIDAGLQVPAFRRKSKVMEKILARFIPTAAVIGGLFIGVLAASADFLGALGTGTGILLTVSILKQYAELLAKEQAAEMHPAMREFLGILG